MNEKPTRQTGKRTESNSVTALGALTRKGVKSLSDTEEANPWMGAGGKFAAKGQGEFRGVKAGYNGPGGSSGGDSGAAASSDDKAKVAAPVPSRPKLTGKQLAKTAAAAAATDVAKQAISRAAAPYIANSPMAFNVPKRRSYAGTAGAAVGGVVGDRLGLDRRSSRKTGRIAGNLASKGIRKYGLPVAAAAMAAAGGALAKSPSWQHAAHKYGSAAGLAYQALRKKSGLKTDIERPFSTPSGGSARSYPGKNIWSKEAEWHGITGVLTECGHGDDVVDGVVSAMHARGYDPKREAAALLRRFQYECERRPELIEASFFSACDRDDQGRCKAHGGGTLAKVGHAAKTAVKSIGRGVKRAGQIGIDSGIINPYTVAAGGVLAASAIKNRLGKHEAAPGARIPPIAVSSAKFHDDLKKALGQPEKQECKTDASCPECGQPRRESRDAREAELCEIGGFRIREFIPLREADIPTEPNQTSVPVVLISAGPGNKRDRNFYPAQMLERSAKVFEGVRSFLNHPTRSEESERPERDVRDSCGWFSNVRVVPIQGKQCVVADLELATNSAGREARELIESDKRYRKTYPERVFVGFSINADGPSHTEIMDGEQWNVVDEIARCMSVDVVTFPARGGKALVDANAPAADWQREFNKVAA